MLDIILRILPILGIIFLILLALVIASALLVLFFPMTYRISASKNIKDFRVTVKLWWLFGFLRAGFQYPEPGCITAKVLCFTLYNSKFPAKKEEKAEQKAKKAENTGKKDAAEGRIENKTAVEEEAGAAKDSRTVQSQADGDTIEQSRRENKAGEEGESSIPENSVESGKFFQKIEKIKYTIHSICDKIKEIWENISYYTELLHEEDTKQLFADVLGRTGKILKGIRPRRIRADILFGTGSPDTTGYIYGVYCMLASVFNCDRMWVTPDFENAVLRGDIEISGYITLWGLLINGLKLVLDKRLNAFIERIKAGKKNSM